MSSGDDQRLSRIVDAVADGAPINWSEEQAAAPHMGMLLDELRQIERIVVSYRHASWPTVESAGPPGSDWEQEPGASNPQGDATEIGATESGNAMKRDPRDRSRTVAARVEEDLGRWGPLLLLERLGEGGFG